MDEQHEQLYPEQQAQETSAPISGQTRIEANFFKDLIRTDEELNNFAMELAGKILNSNNPYTMDDDGIAKPNYIQVGDPLLNDRGIRFIIAYIRTICTKNAHVSNIDDERFYEIMRPSVRTLTDTLFIGMINGWYDLKQENFSAIVEMCSNWMEMSLRRAINEGERNVLKNYTPEPSRDSRGNSKGFLDSLF